MPTPALAVFNKASEFCERSSCHCSVSRGSGLWFGERRLELLSLFLYTFRVRSKKNVLRGEAEQVADTCYVIRLRVFNRLISRVYNEALSARALTVSQFNILTVIVRREPVAPHQISAALQIEKSSLSRNIDLMRRKGWIITKSTGRRSLISVTEEGRNVYKTALPSWKDAQQKALKLAGEEIFQQITATVRSLRKK